MRRTYYKALIARHGYQSGIPVSITETASRWACAEDAKAHYGLNFIDLVYEPAMTIIVKPIGEEEA